MGITAVSGPTLAYGVTLSSSGAVTEYNEQRGPSMADLGEVLLDPRPQFTYAPGGGITSPSSIASSKVYGWAGLFGGPVVDATPITISTNGLISSAFSTSSAATGTVSVLSTNTGNVTKITSFLGATLTAPVTVYAIDGAFSGQGFGSAGTVNIWDPTKAISRAITIAGTSGSSLTNYTINGYDLYGFSMTQTVAGTSAGAGNTVTTAKAFKYVQSVTWSGAGSTNINLGVADVYGFPMRVDHPSYATVWVGASSLATLVANSTTGHGLAALVTATATTADVRGTYTSSIASSTSTGVKFVIFISPSVQNLATIGTTNVWTSSAGNVASSAAGGVNGALNFAGIVGLPQF